MSSVLRIAGIVNDSIVDGPGMRIAVFTQGCHRHCPGCHNQHTWDPNGGKDCSIDEILQRVDSNPLLSGITITGGEPFEQPEPLIELVKEIKKRQMEVAIFSGGTWDELTKDRSSKQFELLSLCDVLVDGAFREDLKSLELKFKGSSNQNTIDIRKSLAAGEVVLMQDGRW